VATVVARRLLDAVPLLVGSSVLVFLLVHLSGDPALLMLSPDTPPEQVAEFRRAHGLDRPLHVQYLRFIGGVLQGDLGESIRLRRPALDLVLESLPATLELAAASLVLVVAVGIPLGVLSAARSGSRLDVLVRAFMFFGQGAPPFWLGLMLIVLFAVKWRLLPSSGRGDLAQLILPSVTLAVYFVAAVARLTRGGLVGALRSDYVRTARSKGLGPARVLYGHALRNVLIPVVTLIGLQTGTLLGGAVVTETIFAWPGVGRLVVDSIYRRDYPVVQAAILVIVVLFVVVNLVVDLSYRLLDPRVRHE
jgi:ABC-type dipeptide/oligopeptide/nickel transport system permease component